MTRTLHDPELDPAKKSAGSTSDGGRLPYIASGVVYGGQLGFTPSRLSIASRVLITFINAYRALRAGKPSPCRFYPTCSAYGLEAITSHGAGRGFLLTARRIGRCRPGGPHGIDLVPERAGAARTNGSNTDTAIQPDTINRAHAQSPAR